MCSRLISIIVHHVCQLSTTYTSDYPLFHTPIIGLKLLNTSVSHRAALIIKLIEYSIDRKLIGNFCLIIGHLSSKNGKHLMVQAPQIWWMNDVLGFCWSNKTRHLMTSHWSRWNRERQVKLFFVCFIVQIIDLLIKNLKIKKKLLVSPNEPHTVALGYMSLYYQ